MRVLHQVAATPLEGEALQREKTGVTLRQLRQREASQAGNKAKRWTAYAREKGTGKVVGYTEIFWSPFEPQTIDQGMTCVLPEHRNRGLGRWLKAALLGSVLDEYPQVERVRTGNGTNNAPMLKINRELGFSARLMRKDWQVDLGQVLSYLAAPETAPARS